MVFCLHVCWYPERPEEALNLLEQAFVSYHVDAETWTQVLWKSSYLSTAPAKFFVIVICFFLTPLKLGLSI